MNCSHRKGRKLPAAVALLVAAWIASLSPPAMAYVGPGAGITLLGSLGAVVSFLVIAAGGLLAWPIRMLRKKLKKGRSEADHEDTPGSPPEV